MSSIRTERYTGVAIALHWAIAAAILANLFLGWWMHDAIKVAATQAQAIAGYQLHKSLGLTVLALSLLRLAWRLGHRPPPLPAAMPAWEQLAARAAHWGFYALMIGLPLSGWLMVSAQWDGGKPLNVPTLWFGLFEVPHLFGLNEMAHEFRASFSHDAEETHEWLARGMAALLVLHVAAALKHRFLDRDAVLAHMLPGWRTLAAVIVLLLCVLAGLGWGLQRTSGAATGSIEISTTPESNWTVDAAHSELAFSGTHAGVPFRGRFGHWQADLRFNPADLEQAQLGGVFKTASARDGVTLHDESLPEKEWFDVDRHPLANFRSTQILPLDEGVYAVEGVLTIKNRAIKVPALRLALNGERMNLSGRFEVDRAEADLGMESDPDGQYVSRKIAVEVRVEATRKP